MGDFEMALECYKAGKITLVNSQSDFQGLIKRFDFKIN